MTTTPDLPNPLADVYDGLERASTALSLARDGVNAAALQRTELLAQLAAAAATNERDEATIEQLRERIRELEAGPTPPPDPEPDPKPALAPIPAGWSVFHEFDFTPAGAKHWVAENPGKPASNNEGIDRPANAIFGAGPHGTDLRMVTNRDRAGGPVYTADIKATKHVVTVPFGALIEVTLDKPMPVGMWPAYPWFRPGTGGNGRGELDPSEIFMGHDLPTRHRFTLHRTGTGTDGYKGANHGKYGESLPLLPEGERIVMFFQMLTDRASMTVLGKTITITKAEFEQAVPKGAGAGSWATLSQAWYARLTNQAGGEGGTIPAAFAEWSALIHRLALLKPA